MHLRSKFPMLSLALVAVLAPASFAADGFGIGFTKQTKHGVLGFGFSTGPVFAPSCEPRCAPPRWVPAHYETVHRRVWVEGCTERVWVEPVYEWRSYGCGRPYYACIRGGHFEHVRGPGHYETRAFRTWVGEAWRS